MTLDELNAQAAEDEAREQEKASKVVFDIKTRDVTVLPDPEEHPDAITLSEDEWEEDTEDKLNTACELLETVKERLEFVRRAGGTTYRMTPYDWRMCKKSIDEVEEFLTKISIWMELGDDKKTDG